MKYLIVLFKNKKRKKIINKFKTFERANDFYSSAIKKSDSVLFPKLFENGKECNYEIGFLESGSTDFDLYFVKDELGRQIKVDIDDPNYRITKIVNYNVEEFLYDINEKTKITFEEFVKKYLPKTGIKLISKINNKIVVQNDDEVSLLSLKSIDDCFRFMSILDNYLMSFKRLDCILVKDTSKQQKKYLYGLLESKGVNKSFLYRRFTTFKRK